MKAYVCTLCGMRYSPEETIQHYDFLHGDRYVICPDCRSECICENREDREEFEECEENEEGEEYEENEKNKGEKENY